MFLYTMEGEAQRALRLANLVERVLHRLGDSDQKIWRYDEILGYLEHAGREMAASTHCVWDMIYLENLPPGFSATADWEEPYMVFFYGVVGYTNLWESEYLPELDMDVTEVDYGSHTSPSDLHHLEEALVPGQQHATAQLPETLLDVERGVYDQQTVPAVSHHEMVTKDHLYHRIYGEIIAFSVERDGYDRLRKIRIPSEMADIVTVDGSWGLARDVEDVTADDQEGTWGIPRRVAGHHPMGVSEGWGAPRRFYLDNDNFKIEYWRQPYVTETESELPSRYYFYLADYAQWKALVRNGPGQSYKLAELYKQRWARGMERITNRREHVNKDRMFRMGGESQSRKVGPPRPRLPWQYGRAIR